MKIPNLRLNNGSKIPSIGFGTYLLRGDDALKAIITAAKNGYRLFDSAMNYDNEAVLGEAIRASGIPRKDFFLTSKLPGRFHTYSLALDAIEESLLRTRVDYFDGYLIHWPNPKEDKYVEAWQALIEAKKRGKIKTIGVCNFLPEHIERLIQETGVAPAINQIELHPFFTQKETLAYHKSKGIITQAWSPFARAKGLSDNEVLKNLALKYNKSIAQVVLRWHIQNGVLPIPKSKTPSRQIENLAIFDFALSAEDVLLIDTLNNPEGRIQNQDPAIYEEF